MVSTVSTRIPSRDREKITAGSVSDRTHDVVVHPRNDESPGDERHSLRRLLGFVEESVPAEATPAVERWLSARRDRLADGRLSCVGHRYDLPYRPAVA